jgi:hypothetical protein
MKCTARVATDIGKGRQRTGFLVVRDESLWAIKKIYPTWLDTIPIR